MRTPISPLLDGLDLDRYRLYETADLDEVREHCSRVFSPHRLDVVGRGQRLHSRMDHLPVGPLSLNRLSWGAAVRVDPERLGGYYLLCFGIEGQAVFQVDGRATTVMPRRAAIVSPAPGFRFEASADFDQLVVRIERTVVEGAWQSFVGHDRLRRIDFDAGIDFGSRAWQSVLPGLTSLARVAGLGGCRGTPALHARLQDAIVTALLLGQPHGAAADLGLACPQRPEPWVVRRAQAVIEARLESPLSLADLAAACGVSGRRLQALFRSTVGMGPMRWLRERRLQAVRATLAAAGGGRVPIMAVAARFGFGHPGEFAAAYRQRFGETPSQTARRRPDADPAAPDAGPSAPRSSR